MSFETENEEYPEENMPRCPDCMTRLTLLEQRLNRWSEAEFARRAAPEISREIGRMAEERELSR